jgi:hypothetical protein
MNYQSRGFIGWALRVCLAASAFLALASCGSSNVPSVSSGPAPVSGPVAVLPGSATLYSETPTTFLVTGGTGSYLLASSDQTVVPVANSFSGEAFTIVPNAVAVDTTVTLTVRDATDATQATVQLLVKPRTVSSIVAITPSAGQSAACGTAVCSGGDAEVLATFSQGGAPLIGRQARFEVVSGDFRIISPDGVETLVTSAVTLTDSTGSARVRIRALNAAESQTALIQITDVTSGAFTRTSFAIAPAGSGTLSALPEVITFTGRDASACAVGVSAEVIVLGGRPPYTVSQPNGFTVSTTVVHSSGGRFIVHATGQCSSGTQIAVVDSAGASDTVTVSNVLGTAGATSPLAVGPTAVTLGTSCSSIASAIVTAGVGASYFAVSGSDYLTVLISGNVVSIRRTVVSAPTPAPPATTIPVAVTDGRTIATISVNVPAGPCVP